MTAIDLSTLNTHGEQLRSLISNKTALRAIFKDKKKTFFESTNFTALFRRFFFLSIGLRIERAKTYAGSMSDLEMFCQSFGFHNKTAKNVVRELNILVKMRLRNMRSDFRAILVAK